MLLGDFDVIVCDGFVGNIVLKVSEGLAEAIGLISVMPHPCTTRTPVVRSNQSIMARGTADPPQKSARRWDTSMSGFASR